MPLSAIVATVRDAYPEVTLCCREITFNDTCLPEQRVDARSQREARLVSTIGAHHGATTRDSARRLTAMVTVAMDADRLSPVGLRVLTLKGARRMSMWAARRRADRRGAVLMVIDELVGVSADGFP